MGCPFCVYAGPSEILARYYGVHGDVYVIEPLNPVTPGHVLCIPVEHAPDALAAPHLASTACRGALKFAQDQGVEECNIITSCGPAATQTVKHLHVHMVPRCEGDGLLLPWSRQSG